MASTRQGFPYLTELTSQRLRELLKYDPLTGAWIWLVKRSGHTSGRRTGISATGKYATIKIYGQGYQAHRLVWLYMTGAWPNAAIDHINRDKSDNRWSTLRQATESQNAANRIAPSNNTSGFKGVCWNDQEKKWIARVQVNGRRPSLGYFDCPAAAHFAYVVAANKHNGEYARW